MIARICALLTVAVMAMGALIVIGAVFSQGDEICAEYDSFAMLAGCPAPKKPDPPAFPELVDPNER